MKEIKLPLYQILINYRELFAPTDLVWMMAENTLNDKSHPLFSALYEKISDES